jgi:hypothetical protein
MPAPFTFDYPQAVPFGPLHGLSPPYFNPSAASPVSPADSCDFQRLPTSSLGDSDASQASRPALGASPTAPSALDAARLQAQKAALSYASARRAPGYSDAAFASAPQQPRAAVQSGERAATPVPKRRRSARTGKAEAHGMAFSAGPAAAAAASAAAAAATAGAAAGGAAQGEAADGNTSRDDDRGDPSGEDGDDSKSDRYKRRLALNRESAAVSRIRRRAYIKELEERLAVVEKEKYQLMGQVEIMLGQNRAMSKQLTDCFRLVAAIQGQSQPPPLRGDRK